MGSLAGICSACSWPPGGPLGLAVALAVAAYGRCFAPRVKGTPPPPWPDSGQVAGARHGLRFRSGPRAGPRRRWSWRPLSPTQGSRPLGRGRTWARRGPSRRKGTASGPEARPLAARVRPPEAARGPAPTGRGPGAPAQWRGARQGSPAAVAATPPIFPPPSLPPPPPQRQAALTGLLSGANRTGLGCSYGVPDRRLSGFDSRQLHFNGPCPARSNLAGPSRHRAGGPGARLALLAPSLFS